MLGNSGVWAQVLSIDFEQDAAVYTDWTLTNITSKATNSAVTASEGSFFGNTSGKTTASITTKDKISSPTDITFFVSKQSNNTTSSTWMVEVSSDNKNWATVGETQSASSMNKGVWVKVSRELKNYKDVYVRISYNGSTAIRCIDDIKLTYESGPSITAYDATCAADATSGTISYTINNPVGDNKISASLVGNCDWITEIDATTTPNKVTFKLAENTSTEPRSAQIKLEYEGAEPKIVTVIQRGVVAKHNVTWSVNGVETTEQVEEGTDITFATPTENIPEGYVFKGWYGSTLEPQDNAPEYVTSALAMADVTYYAVFAKQKGTGSGEQKIELTNERIKKAREDASDTNGYKDNQDIDGWTGKFLYYKNVNNYALQINRNETTSNNAYNSHLTTPVVSSPIQSITIKTNCNTASGRTVYLCSSNDIGAANEANAVYGSGKTDNVNGSITIPVTGNPTQLNIYPYGGVIYIESVTLTYGESATFYDFRTSVTAPTTATITLAEACTDGNGMYYGTYSNSKAFVVPGDMVVSEISVIDNKLLVDSYSTGAVVPANTGVMVSSMTAGDHEVTLSEKAGTSVLGEGNMLRPTGDNGITASEMAEKDADCKFYRLTMHKGTTLGYFWGAAEGAAFDVAANKAYLAVPAAQAAKVAGFAIDGGGTTAIESIENGNGSEVSRKVYNLQGQRVSGALPKGLYIIDGRKVIVK